MSETGFPRFSMAERNRRWGQVRSLMAEAGLDVIVCPPHTGHHDHFSAYSRYLTGLGGYSLEVGAVFPIDGDVTAIVVPDVAPAKWREQQDWVGDIRSHGRAFGDGLVARLKELPGSGAAHFRIGLAGLSSVPRFADGIVAHGFHQRLTAAFPDAELVDCTALLDRARYVKGAEEVEFIRGSVRQVEAAMAALRATARPGVTEHKVYAAMLAAMIEQGSEVPAMIMWAAGPPATLTTAHHPSPRRFGQGDFLRVEVESRYAGYCGQITQTAVLGRLPVSYEVMWGVQQKAFDMCCALARPGITLGDLARQVERVAEGTPCGIRFLMHGRGLGDDAPIYVFSAPEETRRWKLEENTCFIIKPVITREGHADIVWGDSVVITKDGARRLGTMRPEIFELG